MKKVNYSGKRFNNIEVIKEIGYTYEGDRKRGLWLCRCDCGKYIKLSSSAVSSGKQKSCGCTRKGKTCRNGGKRKPCRYEIYDKYVKGYDSNGSDFIVDYVDYERIKEYCWYVSKNGAVQTSINKKTVELHRFIMNLDDKKCFVDHINHDRTDNRRINLRLATCQENSMNRSTPVNNKVGRIGVSYIDTLKKYKARIRYNGKEITGGYFSDFIEAVKCREELEKKYFGEFRNKNS